MSKSIIKNARMAFRDFCSGVSGAAKLVSVTTNGAAAIEACAFGKSLQKATAKLNDDGLMYATNLMNGEVPFFEKEKKGVQNG